MYGLMANCFAWLKRRKEPERKITVIIIGLDDAGKTTTVASIQGEPPDGITPTVGFANKALTVNGKQITAYDLGGGARFRGVWKKYYAEVFGIVFTVDSSNKNRLEESKTVLHEVIEHSRIAGKPVLILANKQDKEEALDLGTIEENLELKEMSEKHKFSYHVAGCSALKGYGKKLDPTIKKGLQWLLASIIQDMSKLAPRVDNDLALQKEENEKEKQARLERIRKVREEREKREREAGIQPEEESDDDVVAAGNPFQPIKKHLEEVDRKKQKKKKVTERSAKEDRESNHVTCDDGNGKGELEHSDELKTSPKKKRKKKKITKSNEVTKLSEDVPDVTDSRQQLKDSPEVITKKKKKKKKKKITDDGDVETEDLGVENKVVDLNESIKTGRTETKTNLVKQNTEHNEMEIVQNGEVHNILPEGQETLFDCAAPSDSLGGRRLEPLNVQSIPKKKKKAKPKEKVEEEDVDGSKEEVKKVKSKKKRKKANRTAPAPNLAAEEPEDIPLPKLPPPAWKTPPGTLNRLPALKPLRSEFSSGGGSLQPSLGPIRRFAAREPEPILPLHSTPNGDDNDVIT